MRIETQEKVAISKIIFLQNLQIQALYDESRELEFLYREI